MFNYKSIVPSEQDLEIFLQEIVVLIVMVIINFFSCGVLLGLIVVYMKGANSFICV